MFKISEIKELVKLLDQTSVQELEIEHDGARLLIRKPSKIEQVVVPMQQVAPSYVPAPQVVQVAEASAQSVAETAAPVAKAAQENNLHRIVSPMVGTFYRSPSPGAASFVATGDRVNDKTVVCIIEAMKLMNEIEAEIKGEIVEVLVENGQLVEYGQPLFLVKPE